MSVVLAPSILSADFTRLREEIREVTDAGAQWIHVDVMDGHFVPNITIGPPVVQAIRNVTDVPLDVHLMITDPDRYLEAFVRAGASTLTVHAEACLHLDRTLNEIRRLGARPGVALNPATPVSVIENVLGLADLVLVMTVNPGFAGQSFIGYTLNKVRAVRAEIVSKSARALVAVDGGIDTQTMPSVLAAGADVLVAGSAVFKGGQAGRKVKEILALVRSLGYDSTYV